MFTPLAPGFSGGPKAWKAWNCGTAGTSFALPDVSFKYQQRVDSGPHARSTSGQVSHERTLANSLQAGHHV